MRAYYGLLPALTHLIPQQPHEERNLNIPILQMKQLRQKKKKNRSNLSKNTQPGRGRAGVQNQDCLAAKLNPYLLQLLLR